MKRPLFLAKKKFGQHFLIDTDILDNIVCAINPRMTDQLIEIGSGPGILTDQLISRVHKLHLIEIDNDWAGYLQKRYENQSQITLHHVDVLKFDWAILSDNNPWRLVGNLPYNISTPLLFHIFGDLELFSDMHFVLQNEVVNRLVAPVNSKNYGRLSVMTQYFCQAQSLLFIPPEAFDPPPKVDSALVRLTPRREKCVKADNFNRLGDIVREAFSFRRKTIGNALKAYFSTEQLKELGIDPQLRPQNLTVDQYVILANA